jgi:amidase
VGVARLKAAGAIILGKTNVPPFLSDWQSANPVYGRTNHPLDAARTPGGSSGGSAAALAAGMTPLEFGSDIGGSIRVPAAFCGVFGHKPSFDLIPQRGHAPPGIEGANPLLGVVGPLARSVEDLELALDILAGPEPAEARAYHLALPPARHERLADYRVLVIDSHPVARLDAEIGDALRAFADRLVAAGVKVERGATVVPDLAESFEVYRRILMPIITRGAADGPDPGSAHEWLFALDRQWAFRQQWAALFEAFDVVVAPAFGVVAFEHQTAPFEARTHLINGEVTAYGDQVAWPAIATLPNLPATAMPVAKTKSGLPIGVQVIGPYLEDRTPLAFARLAGRL